MGSGQSSILDKPIDSELLQGAYDIKHTPLYHVTFHHTVQNGYRKYSIIKYRESSENTTDSASSNGVSGASGTSTFDFSISDLLSSASLLAKVRHPHILHVYKALPDPIANSLFLIAENSVPLTSFPIGSSSEGILHGIRDILSALDFFHTNLGLSHNGIDETSIYVCSNVTWKLGSTELASKFDKMSCELIASLEKFKGKSDKKALSFDPSYGFAYDMYCLSRMICSLHVPDDGDLKELMEVLEKSCMHAEAKLRLSPTLLLKHPSFRNPYTTAVTFIENYMTYNDSEKEEFFASFNEKIAQHLSERVLCQNLLLRIFENNNIFLDYPSRRLIIDVLRSCQYKETVIKPPPNLRTDQSKSMADFISPASFRQYLIPILLRKFRLHERHTRLILLHHFDGYMHLLSAHDLRVTILPEVCLSVFDHYDLLSVVSLRTIGDLANLLSATTVLDRLRQTENELRQSHKFTATTSTTTTNSHKDVPNAGNSSHLWPRATLFKEAAPKLGCKFRQSAIQKPLAKPVQCSLAELASLSKNYDPSRDPHLAIDALKSTGPPVPLEKSAIKISKPKSTTPSHAHIVNPNSLGPSISSDQSISPLNEPILNGNLRSSVSEDFDQSSSSVSSPNNEKINKSSVLSSDQLAQHSIDNHGDDDDDQDRQVNEILAVMQPNLVNSTPNALPADHATREPSPLPKPKSDIANKSPRTGPKSRFSMTNSDQNELVEVDEGDGWDEPWEFES